MYVSELVVSTLTSQITKLFFLFKIPEQVKLSKKMIGTLLIGCIEYC